MAAASGAVFSPRWSRLGAATTAARNRKRRKRARMAGSVPPPVVVALRDRSFAHRRALLYTPTNDRLAETSTPRDAVEIIELRSRKERVIPSARFAHPDEAVGRREPRSIRSLRMARADPGEHRPALERLFSRTSYIGHSSSIDARRFRGGSARALCARRRRRFGFARSVFGVSRAFAKNA